MNSKHKVKWRLKRRPRLSQWGLERGEDGGVPWAPSWQRLFDFEAVAHLSAVRGAGVRGLCVCGVIECDRAALQIRGTVVRERWPAAGS